MNKIRRHKIKKEFKDVDKPKASTAAASAAVKIDQFSEEKDLTYYLHDRVELMHQIFSMLKPRELMAMAPDCIRNLKIDDVQELCLEEVLGISSKRLCAILDGAEPPSDTETSSSDESIQPKPAGLDQLETISLDSISSDEVEDEDDRRSLSSKGSRRKKHSHAKKHKHTHQPSSQPRVPDKPRISESSQAIDNTGDSKAAERAGMTVLELLELQARARAIRAQLALENTTKDEKTTTNKTVPSAKKSDMSASSSSESADSSHHSSICIKEEPAEVLEVPGSSSEDEKTVLREQRERGKKTSGTASTSTAAGSSSASTSQPPRKSDLTIIVPQTHSRKIKLKRNKVVVQVTNVLPEKKSQAHSKSDNKDRMPKSVIIVENVEAKTISNKTDEVIKIKAVENDKMEAKGKDEVKMKETKIANQSDKPDKLKRSRTKKSRNYRSRPSREGSDHDEITLQLSDTEKMDLLENFDPKNYENVSSSSSNVESDEESPLKNNSNTQIQIDGNEGTSDKTEATSDEKEATYNQKEATNDKTEATYNKKEATNDKTGATYNKKEALNDKSETTYNKNEATYDKKEATNDRKEVTNNEKEAINDEEEATNDKKEVTNNEKEATYDDKEAINDKKEATNDKKEATHNQKEATNNKKEAINDNKEIVNLEKTVESNKQNLDEDVTGNPENTSESQVKETFFIESNTEKTNPEKVLTNFTEEHIKNTHNFNNHSEIQPEDKELKESEKSTEVTNAKNEDVNTETENNSEINNEKIILNEEKTENDKIELPAERKSEINKEGLKENKEESEKEQLPQLKADTKSDGELSEKSSSDIEMLEKPPEIICISDEEVKEAAKKSKKNKKEKKAKKKSKKHSKKSGFCKSADRDSSVQRKNEEDLSATDNIVILNDTEETDVSKRVVIEETNEETSKEIEEIKNERRKSATKETIIELESEKSDDLEEDVYEVNDEIYEISDESSGSESDFKILSKEPTSEEIEELSQRIDTEIEREEIISEDQIRTSNMQIKTGATEGSNWDTNSMVEESGKNEHDTEDFEEELSWKHRWLESKKVQKIMVTSNIFNAIRKKNKELKLKLAQKKNETESPMVESERIETSAAENPVVEVSKIDEGPVEENAIVEGSIDHYNMLEGSTKYVDPVADANATELDKSMRKDAKQLMRMYKKLVKAHSDSKKSESERKAKKERKKARREKRKALAVKNVEETPLNES